MFALRPSHSRRHVCALAAALIAACALAMPSGAFAAAKGIETEITWDVSSSEQTQDANAMSDLGVSWTRIILSWHDAETRQGSYDSSKLAEIDNAVSLARARGINIDMVVYEAPQWSSGTSNKNAPPQNPQDYANFIHNMALRYPGVAAWEIWNEENLPHFWNGSTNPAAYAALLKDGYSAVKSANPGATVVFGGMSNADYQFLSDVYAAAPDIGNYYDVMAEHPYPGGDSPDLATYDSSGHLARNSFPGYRSVRQVMLDHGTDKPMWFTEMGWSTTSQPGGVTAQQQADYIRLAFACMNNDPYIQAAMVYELRNNYWANNADDWEDQLGLVTTNWSHKPAYDAFKTTDPGATGCVYHTGDGRPIDGQPAGSSSSSSSTTSSSSTSSRPGSGSSTITLKHRVTVHVRRSKHVRSAQAGRRVKLTFVGTVANARSGRVILRIERKRADGRWRRVRSISARVTQAGRFKRSIRSRAVGRWRVRAVYVSAPAPVPSRFAYFRV